MDSYFILQNPGHNWVYYQESEKLALSELKLCCLKLDLPNADPQAVEVCGVRYFRFFLNRPFDESISLEIGRLSFFFALFKSENDRFLPIAVNPKFPVEKSLSGVQKYIGKTNELFTRMMVNIGRMFLEKNSNIRLLDPVAGRGTTLFEGVHYGMKSYGIEIEKKSIEQANLFIKKYLQGERFKYSFSKNQVSGSDKKNGVFMETFEFAKNKADFKDDSSRLQLSFVNGNTLACEQFFKRDFFDLIIGDLPYGVQHGNKKQHSEKNFTRSPEELVTDGLLGWKKTLRKSGIVVLGWNVNLFSYKKMAALFESQDFDVLGKEAYLDFQHQVDQAIKRNILVARKL
ncbi:MAG: TRM11 family SAM-dependent methyltransferase [Flavobacteriaceae bacterium]